jgi:hypothetical protein
MTSNYWQCAKCGALRAKDDVRRRTAEKFIETDAPVFGEEWCTNCSTRYEADEVYRGRMDPPQPDGFITKILADPTVAQFNARLKVWTRRDALSKDDVVVLALDAATVAHYREHASPLQLAAVALAKSDAEPDLLTDDLGLVVPGGRIKADFPSWRVWISALGEVWVTKKRVAWEEYSSTGIPERLKQALCAGPVPAVPYLVSLCMAAGLDPNKLSPLEAKLLDESTVVDT